MEVLDAVGPLNQLLCGLHGPTDDIGRTMNHLVPFPGTIASLPDADLLDLNVLVKAGPLGQASASVEATARYATSARASQVRTFYNAQFAHAGAAVRTAVPGLASTNAIVRATLADERATSYGVLVDEFRGYRSVKVNVAYRDFDARSIFERFAGWHNGAAPVPSLSEPTGLEISTFANGRQPNTVVLYSTYFECPRTSGLDRRASVERRIEELGWTYREPREGIMFIQDGHFDAETHVAGDAHRSNVTFVGEFQLR